MFVGDYLTRRALYSAEETALVDVYGSGRLSFTYSALRDRANRLAAWLRQQRIQKGDRVAILALDSVHHYDLFFACSKIGAIFVPFNWRLHAEELIAHICLTTPKLLFHDDSEPVTQTLKRTADKMSEMPHLQPLPADKRNILPFPLAEPEENVTCESITEEDTACLLFTGGTTGEAKAAQISHKHIVWNTFNALLADVLGSDTFLNVFPLFHTGGLFAFSIPLLILGGTVVQMHKFDANRVLDLIDSESVTIFAGVPSVFQSLTEATNWPQANLHSLRYCLSGGAPMPVPLIKEYAREKGVVFRQGFGMTEFGPDAFSLASEDAERKAGSIGRPNFFVDARVVDVQTQRPLPPNTTGELVLRGPAVTTGYFKNDAATEASFDDERYFHTGDLAFVDEEGYFFIVDRLKDMFISGGENVYPAEVEAVLYRMPEIQSCAVIGVPDEKWGQAGYAFVVVKQNAALTENDVIAHTKNYLAKYKVPKYVHFVDRLPTSAAGKILKRELQRLVKTTQ